MKLRFIALALIGIGAGCHSPEITPAQREAVDLGLARTTALMITPSQSAPRRDLLICTLPEMDESSSLAFIEKVARLGYRVLWVRTPAPADPAAAAALLQAGAGRLTAPGKKGAMLFGLWPECCPGLEDTTFQALIWVTSAGQAERCLGGAVDTTLRRPRLALVIPAVEAVTLTSAWRGWIDSGENLIWLATSQPVTALLQSDLEPIVRRKAQLFFDRYLKGKK
ncbi:MAG TPA: hypothetical protein PKI62_09915 [bacterium]|nr:hypothetical protein [bacterium]HPR88828.1 hypothetical protein [bacterium]